MKDSPAGAAALPRVVVAGLGPAGPDLVPARTLAVAAGAARVFVRTQRHPAVVAVLDASAVPVYSFDHHYERSERFEDVYAAILEDLVAAALEVRAGGDAGAVVYAVPGSPMVAERSVALLRADGRVVVEVVHAPSFLDLAWDRLGVDPLAQGVRLVDGTDLAVGLAGERGPLLVAQVHDRSVLSTLKLAVEDGEAAAPEGAVILHHLGLADERVVSVAWSELDRTLEPDHLTSVWIPTLAAPVAAEVVRLAELVRTLRTRCPWDREQTHGSLARHLLEEAYETLEAVEAFAAAEPDVPASLVAHLEEELGDLLFQVLFHATLAEEEGRFTLADVARGTHDKLVARHPHVFADAVADTPEEVAARWEVLKKAEKGRRSVTDGIPAALPSLALSAKLQRKAESVGMQSPTLADRLSELADGVDTLAATPAARATHQGGASGETLEGSPAVAEEIGRLLFALADASRRLGVDPETALRARATLFRRQVEASE